MKTITLTIKRECTYKVQIDEKKIDPYFIKSWSESITDITEKPDELPWNNKVKVRDYPYLNLAKDVAYNVFVNDADYIESLEFQHIVDNDFLKIEPDRENYSVWHEQIGYTDTEYEFDLDNCKL